LPFLTPLIIICKINQSFLKITRRKISVAAKDLKREKNVKKKRIHKQRPELRAKTYN